MKFVPVTTTEEPRLPLVGEKLVIVGAAACAAPANTSVATRVSRAAPAVRNLWGLTVTSSFLPGFLCRGVMRASTPGGGVRIQRNHATGAGRVARSGDLIPRRYDPRIAADGPDPLTFDDIARLVVDLAGRLRGTHDLMLVITRGGLIPGGILA
jgi:hypothetical protein